MNFFPCVRNAKEIGFLITLSVGNEYYLLNEISMLLKMCLKQTKVSISSLKQIQPKFASNLNLARLLDRKQKSENASSLMLRRKVCFHFRIYYKSSFQIFLISLEDSCPGFHFKRW